MRTTRGPATLEAILLRAFKSCRLSIQGYSKAWAKATREARGESLWVSPVAGPGHIAHRGSCHRLAITSMD